MRLTKRIRAFVLALMLTFSIPNGVNAPTMDNTDKGETNPPATNPNITPNPEPKAEPTPIPDPEQNKPKEPEVEKPKVQPQPKKEVKSYLFIISFYTELEGEGQGLTSSGKRVSYGMVANNQLPFGTKIQLQGMGAFTVEDRGSPSHFNRVERIDVYIPRKKGESNATYQERVIAMGVKRVRGTIL